MIINTGARTDTAQYYHRWLLTRFREGFVYVRNPLFPDKVSRYTLDPAVVDCVVFCSKNYAPLLGGLHEISERYNAVFHFTITAYGADIEPGVPSVPDAVETPVVTLDAAPRAVRFVGCRGTADGAAVTLSRIEPFGVAGLVCEFDRSEKEKE